MTETINVTVSGQEISIQERELWVAKTGAVYVMSFTFTGWTNFTTRKAVFQNVYGDREEVTITDGSCTLPASALMDGELKVGCYGTGSGVTQLSTKWAFIRVHIGAKNRILEDDYGIY